MSHGHPNLGLRCKDQNGLYHISDISWQSKNSVPEEYIEITIAELQQSHLWMAVVDSQSTPKDKKYPYIVQSKHVYWETFSILFYRFLYS